MTLLQVKARVLLIIDTQQIIKGAVNDRQQLVVANHHHHLVELIPPKTNQPQKLDTIGTTFPNHLVAAA